MTYTLNNSKGEPVLEFDPIKENPELHELMNSGVELINKMQSSSDELKNIKVNNITSTVGLLWQLKQIRHSEDILRDLYSEKSIEIRLKLKNFIIHPQISATGAFYTQYLTEVLTKSQMISNDIDSTYSDIVNKCISLRVDLLARFSVWLAILSILVSLTFGVLSILN